MRVCGRCLARMCKLTCRPCMHASPCPVQGACPRCHAAQGGLTCTGLPCPQAHNPAAALNSTQMQQVPWLRRCPALTALEGTSSRGLFSQQLPQATDSRTNWMQKDHKEAKGKQMCSPPRLLLWALTPSSPS